jgi:hypothetical protein
METEMKMIMSALAASVLLAVAAAPAGAEEVSDIVRQYVNTSGVENGKYVKVRKYVPRQPVYIADDLEVGSKEWWQQMDRERRGGRR